MAELLLRRQHGEQLAEAKKAVAVNYRTSEPVVSRQQSSGGLPGVPVNVPVQNVHQHSLNNMSSISYILKYMDSRIRHKPSFVLPIAHTCTWGAGTRVMPVHVSPCLVITSCQVPLVPEYPGRARGTRYCRHADRSYSGVLFIRIIVFLQP